MMVRTPYHRLMATTSTDQRAVEQSSIDRDEPNTARSATDDEFFAAYAREKQRWTGLLDRLK
ncbi:hypothetical protein SEA_SEKHMET_34 [Gordonia phage Sekhmet]|uniref:Uncharacterized protein n=1 Tax=Gordonia phage Sekhmet TaxID=2591209 RepID=A0A514DID2_9CAUD|nr:hypothetical protein PP503_gp34 [Gordonia phage Sekhmet]QDH93372.1 hypothetical protein SEA_SEKHMET_34 [Gordonia phage Sekhmet]